MLARPVEEGPVILVIFDGINQEPSINWLGLMQVFQGAEFNGRVRIIVSTRPDHYSDKLARLRGLEYQPIEIPVKDFDAEPNGELDQMLAMHILKREALQPDLIKFACNPRMFQLVKSGKMYFPGDLKQHLIKLRTGIHASNAASASF